MEKEKNPTWRTSIGSKYNTITETCDIHTKPEEEQSTENNQNSENPQQQTDVQDDNVKVPTVEGLTESAAKELLSYYNLKCTVNVNKESNTYERFVVAESNVYLKDDYQGKDIMLIPENTQLKVTEVKYSATYTWGKTNYSDKDGWVILNSCKYVNGNFDGEVLKPAPYLEVTKKNTNKYITILLAIAVVIPIRITVKRNSTLFIINEI